MVLQLVLQPPFDIDVVLTPLSTAKLPPKRWVAETILYKRAVTAASHWRGDNLTTALQTHAENFDNKLQSLFPKLFTASAGWCP